MDLIAEMTKQLGISTDSAHGIAGTLLTTVQGAVQQAAGPEAASQLAGAVPELPAWQAAATKVLGGSGDAGGLLEKVKGLTGGAGGDVLGALGGFLAGGQSPLTGLLQRFGLDAAQVQALAPIVLNFVKAKLPPELGASLTGALPLLTSLLGGAGAGQGGLLGQLGGALSGGGAGGLGGALSGALGGLLGGDNTP